MIVWLATIMLVMLADTCCSPIARATWYTPMPQKPSASSAGRSRRGGAHAQRTRQGEQQQRGQDEAQGDELEGP